MYVLVYTHKCHEARQAAAPTTIIPVIDCCTNSRERATWRGAVGSISELEGGGGLERIRLHSLPLDDPLSRAVSTAQIAEIVQLRSKLAQFQCEYYFALSPIIQCKYWVG